MDDARAFEREWRARLELRDLVERYGSTADRRDRRGFANVFTEDGVFVTSEGRSYVGRQEIASLVDGLSALYERTMHFVGRQDVQFGWGEARGSVTCLAHHLSRPDDGPARDTLMLIEYSDTYTQLDDRWHIARRQLGLAWTLERALGGD